MTKAAKRVSPAKGVGNGPPLASLSLNQTAAALVALLNGADTIPETAHLRSMVRKATERSRRSTATASRQSGREVRS